MDPKYQPVECEHGVGFSTFVCCHLRVGICCGFHSDTPSDQEPWPDAWCDYCEVFRAAADGWNEQSEGQTEISMLCNHCYELARERNRSVPEPLELGRVATSDVLEKLTARACQVISERQERASETSN